MRRWWLMLLVGGRGAGAAVPPADQTVEYVDGQGNEVTLRAALFGQFTLEDFPEVSVTLTNAPDPCRRGYLQIQRQYDDLVELWLDDDPALQGRAGSWPDRWPEGVPNPYVEIVISGFVDSEGDFGTSRFQGPDTPSGDPAPSGRFGAYAYTYEPIPAADIAAFIEASDSSLLEPVQTYQSLFGTFEVAVAGDEATFSLDTTFRDEDQDGFALQYTGTATRCE